MKFAKLITSFTVRAPLRTNYVVRWSSTAIASRNQVFWDMLELKNNGGSISDIVEPLAKYKKTTTQAPPESVYRLLFDISENSQDRDSVILEFARYYDYHLFLTDPMHLSEDKFPLLLQSLKRVNNYTSLSDVWKLLLPSSHHDLIDKFISYAEGSMPSYELASSLSSIETSRSSLYTSSLILKYITDANDPLHLIDKKLVHDIKILKYATKNSTSLILKLFFLQFFSAAYKNSSDPQKYRSKIESIITSFETQLKNFDWKHTKISNSVKFFTQSGSLSDLIEGCVKHKDVKLGVLVHNIFHTPNCFMIRWDKSRYFANMIHLQCIARLLNPDLKTLHSIPDMTKFIEYDFLSEVTQYFLRPDVHIYFAYLHLASLDFTQTKQAYIYLGFLVQTKQTEKMAPVMTKWTHYFPNPSELHVNVYCSVLQLTTRHAIKANIFLSEENMRDLLVYLSPRLESTEDVKQLNKFLNFLNSELYLQFEKSEREMPVQYHNLILQAFSKMQIFESVHNKFKQMAFQQVKMNSTTLHILLDAAMRKYYKDHLEYIIHDVWLMNPQSNSKDTGLLRKFLTCSIRAKNADKIIQFLDCLLKNGVPITEFKNEIVRLHKICKNQEVLNTFMSFKNLLSEYADDKFQDILIDINNFISEQEIMPPITSMNNSISEVELKSPNTISLTSTTDNPTKV